MAKFIENLGEFTPDNLVKHIRQDAVSAVIRKGTAAETYKRGTVLAMSSGEAGDGKLVILGTAAVDKETLTAYGILTDDVEVGTAADEVVTVYVEGTFNANALTVKGSYTLTDADIKALRDGGIYLEAFVK